MNLWDNMKIKMRERKDIKAVRKNVDALKDVQNQTDKVIFEAFDAHGPVIVKHIRNLTPDLYQRLESYRNMLLDYSNVLSAIPEEKLTQEICIEGVKHSILLLDDVPKKYQTYDLYLEYVRHLCVCLDDVPAEFIDTKLCEVAVAANFENIKFVPAECQTEAMYEEAFKQNEEWIRRGGQGFNLLQYMYHQTEAICLRGVKQKGLSLKDAKYQNDEICLAAVRQNGLALEFVENQTKEICFEAVDNNRKALMHIRDKELAQLTALYANSSVKTMEM